MVFTFSLHSRAADFFSQAQKIVSQHADSRVVMVGETHVRNDHHQLQLAFLRAMHQQHPQLAIGVEWFQKPFQSILDQYVAGAIDEAELLQETQYFSRWRYDFRMYRPILQYARQHRIPLIALNVPRELTNAIAMQGLDNLPDDLKQQLPGDYDFSRQAYRELLQEVFAMHEGMHGQFEYFYQGQLTWDEGMAETAATYLKTNPQSAMVIFAGAGHIESDHGIPSRLQRRSNIDPLTVLMADQPGDYPQTAADYILLSEDSPLPPPGKLGVGLEERGQLLLIREFSDNSVLKEAGLPVGAVIVKINDLPISSYASLKLALLDYPAGETVTLTWLRDAQTQDLQPQTVQLKLR